VDVDVGCCGWVDWADVGADGLLGVLGLLEVEVLGGGVLLVGDEVVVDDPDPLGTEGTVGVGRFGVETVGVVSAEADGSAAMPTTASTVIAPTTSFRLRSTVVDLLPGSARNTIPPNSVRTKS